MLQTAPRVIQKRCYLFRSAVTTRREAPEIAGFCFGCQMRRSVKSDGENRDERLSPGEVLFHELRNSTDASDAARCHLKHMNNFN